MTCKAVRREATWMASTFKMVKKYSKSKYLFLKDIVKNRIHLLTDYHRVI